MSNTIVIRWSSLVFQVDEGGEGVKIPPGMAMFMRENLEPGLSDVLTFEELESAFVGWWAPIMHPIWMVYRYLREGD